MFYVMEKIPVIGTIVGVIIIVIGVYSLATSFGLQQVTVDDVYPVGDRIQYSFNAPSDAVQTLHVTGDSFMVQIEGPGISRNESYTDETTLTWSHSTECSILFISNTSDMTVKGTALISSDLIHTAYHGMVIISGIVILGFSAGFSKRKPVLIKFRYGISSQTFRNKHILRISSKTVAVSCLCRLPSKSK